MAGPCIVDTESVVLTTTDSDELQADVQVSLQGRNGLTVLADGLWTPGAPEIVSALPTSLDPTDDNGLQVVYRISSTVRWLLMYLGEDDAWMKLGGPRMAASVDASGTKSGTSYGDLGSGAGPSVTLPADIGGSFDIYLSASMAASGTGVTAFASFRVGGTAAADADGLSTDSATHGVPGYHRERKSGVAAGTELEMKYRSGDGSAMSARDRQIEVDPVLINAV